MIDFKTINVITLAIALSALASNASAQTNPALETAHPSVSQPALTVKSADSDSQVLPTTRKIQRVDKRLPIPTAARQYQKSVYGGVINADTSKQKIPTRFVYKRSKDDIVMPVYSKAESMKSK